MSQDCPIGDATDQTGGGVTFDEGEDDEPAPGGLDLGAADDLVGAIVAPLDQDVGEDGLDQGQGSVVVEDGDDIDALQGGQDLGACVLGIDGTGRALEAGHAGV